MAGDLREEGTVPASHGLPWEPRKPSPPSALGDRAQAAPGGARQKAVGTALWGTQDWQLSSTGCGMVARTG